MMLVKQCRKPCIWVDGFIETIHKKVGMVYYCLIDIKRHDISYKNGDLNPHDTEIHNDGSMI